MRQFFKFFFASVLGSMVGLGLAFFFLVLIIVSISAALVSKAKDSGAADVKPNSVLYITLDYDIHERTSNNPFEELDFSTFEPKTNLGLNDILAGIEKAKGDDNIKGIYLDISFIPAGMATVEAIRNELLDFKSSEKFIIAYGEIITQKSYYLASVADEIYGNPSGFMDFRGFHTELVFFKNMLDKLEIEPQVIYAGKFKSATEPFRLDKMSDANREQISSLMRDTYGHFLSNIGSQRKISVETLDSIASNLVVRDIKDAVKAGLIDDVLFFDQVLAKLKEKTGTEESKDLNSIELSKYGKNPEHHHKGGGSKDKIAVLYAQGSIVDGKGEEDNIGSERFAKTLREIRKDEDVKALVFRINSGGGSALASDVIWREITLLKQKMPVIVSMGDVAASGGYYIACEADTIVAEPNTITGSIGVFGLLPNMQGFFNNKLGVTFDHVGTGKFSGWGTISRPLTEEEKLILQQIIDTIYIDFKQRVADGRGMTVEDVDSIAQGRVWTGTQALEIGLVDVIGGMDKAIEIAAAKAGLEKYDLKEFPKQKDPFEKIMEEFTANAETWMLKKKLGEQYPLWKKMEEIKDLKGVQARAPFDIEIY